jgi:hypothetical protein
MALVARRLIPAIVYWSAWKSRQNAHDGNKKTVNEVLEVGEALKCAASVRLVYLTVAWTVVWKRLDVMRGLSQTVKTAPLLSIANHVPYAELSINHHY